MKRTFSTALIGIAALLTVTLVATPMAHAAGKKPGLFGPAVVTVGQEVTYTSVFKAAPKYRDGCFAPTFTFSDSQNSNGFGVVICMSFSDGKGAKPKPKIETDTKTHVFVEPGTYTVKVEAAGLRSGDGGVAVPKNASVKGPRSYSMTVTVVAQ
jgi:hypothetical protein